jgi:DNA sulfur modification protein DndE
VKDQVLAMNAAMFFNILAINMEGNPPLSTDKTIMKQLHELGLKPGTAFDLNKLDPLIVKGIQKSVKSAQHQIQDYSQHAGTVINGWKILRTGDYGTNYLKRAYVALDGLGANLPEDAIYMMAEIDKDGESFTGENNYVIHFAKDELPPVNGFWSLTMYNNKLFFVDNPLNRFSVGQRNNFKYNPDGSLDIYIQKLTPGADKEANWLPAPKGHFILCLRLYWPKKAALNDWWNPPPVEYDITS